VFDALVIGGGPAGATAAALLAQAGWTVAVAEKSRFPRDKVCGGFLAPTCAPLLEKLGLSESFARMAGPEIRRVGLFAGEARLSADMPRAPAPGPGYGRAVRRDEFDAMLLERARDRGATVYQPRSIVGIEKERGGFLCFAREERVRARVVIAAHGSWMPGPLATQPRRAAARGSDLFGFKAHFRDAALPADLMPLVAFPGGYGGIVNTDDGCTLSFCVRRDMLTACRSRYPRMEAGDAVLAHIANACSALRDALGGARREGPWLATGPVRPGVRQFFIDGVFVTGNAAGEAHPAIAEGIGMAMQSAAMLCRALIARPRAEREAASDYEERWRARFGLRVTASALIAQTAMRPWAIELSERLMRRVPLLLTYFAELSGKAAAA
jgi:flavin-dependent dehydrogenase